jgi:hypothetical protein
MHFWVGVWVGRGECGYVCRFLRANFDNRYLTVYLISLLVGYLLRLIGTKYLR